jgi:tetratricopeptide (TPR) repeat protein
VSNLLIGVLGALVATNQPAALSNLVTQTTGISVAAIDTNSPVEKELQKIEDDDDAAAAEVDGWIRENDKFAAEGAGVPQAEMNRRIRARFEPSRKAYEDFIRRHPDYARGRVAYASFLHDLGDEEGEMEQLLKAREVDATIPSIWNNLGNYYGEHGPLTNAFVCYEKAIQLDPSEPVYYQNFGTTVYLYRKDVKEFYHINEQQVFDKALALYAKATKLDPTNFVLASDVAMTYYGIKPLRTNDALTAWTNALNLASDESDREGVYLHLARINMSAGRFAEAQARLDSVTNPMYNDLKKRLARNLNEKEHPETVTNEPPAAAEATDPAPTNSPGRVP